MTDRLRVVRRGFVYPADAESLAMVRAAGGVSRLSPEQRARLRFKSVAVGDDCSDMPAESAAIFLARGDIERIPTDLVAATDADPDVAWADLGRPADKE